MTASRRGILAPWRRAHPRSFALSDHPEGPIREPPRKRHKLAATPRDEGGACVAKCPFCDHRNGRSDAFIWRACPCATNGWDADADPQPTHSRGGDARRPPPRVPRNRGARGGGARLADPTVRKPPHRLGTHEHVAEYSGSLAVRRGGRQRDVEPHVLRREPAQLVH